MNIEVYEICVRTTEHDLLYLDVLPPSGKGDKATQHTGYGWKASAGTRERSVWEKRSNCRTRATAAEMAHQRQECGNSISQMEG